jgi:natural resistance-associated macrophage protein
MSLAYLDPGNLESDLQQGAYTGYQLVWVLWWSTVMGFVLQEMSSRLGVVTGLDLAEMCEREYPRSVSLALYAMMVGIFCLSYNQHQANLLSFVHCRSWQ